jgi:hypothetical protein
MMQASELQTDTELHQPADPAPVPEGGDTGGADDQETVDEQPTELSRDEVFGILSNPRRRAAIHHMNDHPDELVQLRDLAERLAAWENDVERPAVTYKQRKRVYTSLYQSHLPKMDDLGIVHFDKNRGTVETTEWTLALHEYLDGLEETDDGRWKSVAACAVGAGLALLAGVVVGPLVVGAGTPLGVGIGAVLGAIGATAALSFEN